jgi:AraC family transcriptional regulator
MDQERPDRFEKGRAMLLGGLRRRHDFDTAARDIPRQWEEFNSWKAFPDRVGQSSYGVMCGHDTSGFEYMTGVEVSSFERLPEGTGRMRVPEQEYAVFVHTGPASAIRSTWDRALQWLESGSYESAHKPDFELYGPDYDPATTEGGTEIWLGVVRKL